MAKTRGSKNYLPVKVAPGATLTSDVPISDEALEARRAEIERAEGDRVSLHGAKPVDVLRTMLATPPMED